MEIRSFGRCFLLRIVFLIMYSRISVQSDENASVGGENDFGAEDAVMHDIDNEDLPNESNLPEEESTTKAKSIEKLTIDLIKDSTESRIPAKVNMKNINLLIRIEPGFNYTTDEMKKLKIWDRGVIPYFIDDFSFDYNMREKIRKILNSFNKLTGIHFTELPAPPANEKERWVFFINRRGVLSCEDYTTNSFTITGVQRVVLGYDCLGSDVNGAALAPTILALAGVPPQHNSPDRDRYIRVNINNVIPEKRSLFRILNDNEWLFHDIEYDYLSAGHYDFHKYTINGSATIEPLGERKYISGVGQGDGISLKDIWKIKMLYNYISLNRHKAKLSDCNRIFMLGAAFQNFRPTESSVIPRDKPNKYSGSSSNADQYNHNYENVNNVVDTINDNGGNIVDAVEDPDSNLHLKKRKKQKYLQLKTKLKNFQDSDYDTDKQ